MKIFLSGPMGSGKSTVAVALARARAVRCVDVDAEIEARAGRPIAAIFAERGESGFRELERQCVRELLASERDAVFALGGGAVTDRALRRELLRQGVLITLLAGPEELARRVGDGEGRPMLAGADAVVRLRELLEARAEAYAECHARIDTEANDIQAVVAAIRGVVEDPPIVVPLGTRTYRIEVAPGCRARAASRVASIAPQARALLVTDDIVEPLWGSGTASALRAAGLDVSTIVIPAGERHKVASTVELIWDRALSFGIDRHTAVLALGGGVVGDLAGFAASTLLRGLAVGHVPTTLLAMADSAVGGKTGFDTAHGKNLIGSFHQPSFVLCDVEVLSTLGVAERRAGLAEVVKSAWIEGETAVATLERDAARLSQGDVEATNRAIKMAVALKARVVTEDERESSVRAWLNLGHTLGHAIEASLGYQGMRHGEAVALGMVAAFRVAVRVGHARPEALTRLVRLLEACGLPTQVDAHLDPRTLSYMASDKKRRGAKVTFVLPGEPGVIALRPFELTELGSLMRG